MKKNYVISYITVVAILLILAGAGLMFFFSKQLEKYDHPLQLNAYNQIELTEGQWVVCNVEKYVAKAMTEGNVNNWTGETVTTVSALGKDQTFFCIPNGEGYVILAVRELENLIKLRAFRQGEGESVIIRGQVRKGAVINQAWFQKINGFPIEKIAADYSIYEETDSMIRFFYQVGIGLLVLGCVLFLMNPRLIQSFETRKPELNCKPTELNDGLALMDWVKMNDVVLMSEKEPLEDPEEWKKAEKPGDEEDWKYDDDEII